MPIAFAPQIRGGRIKNPVDFQESDPQVQNTHACKHFSM